MGLCSYYLIGFYYHKPSAASAGKKAFLTNRVGDFGFGLGVMLIWTTFGTLNYTEVFEKIGAGGIAQSTLIAISLLLFMGAMGKSAQFPLHVWLPDAMEGPTPVSALIHAATMVTAGVYMVARSSVIFASAHEAMLVVGAIGAFTAIFAASIGIAQKDIKRVMAYSTVSQLGYMFMALGVGAWVAAIFHLVMHAFFKALLFLGSGSVIHSLSGEQDMRQDGRIDADASPTRTGPCSAGRSLWPASSPSRASGRRTRSWASTSRTAPTSSGSSGSIAAFITAFYTFRMIFMTFWGESRVEPEVEHHLHESPWVMIVPLMVLAALSVVGGFIGFPPENGPFHKFLEPVFAQANHILGVEHEAFSSLDVALMATSVGVAVLGVALSYLFYVRKPKELPAAGRRGGSVGLQGHPQQVVHRRDLQRHCHPLGGRRLAGPVEARRRGRHRRYRQRCGETLGPRGPDRPAGTDRTRGELRGDHVRGSLRHRHRRADLLGPEGGSRTVEYGFAEQIGFRALTLLTFLPALGALVMLLFMRQRPNAFKATALVTSLATCALSLYMLTAFDTSTAAFQFQENFVWIQSFGINYHVGVDGISMLLILLTTFLSVIAIIGSWNYVKDRELAFFISLLLLETGMIGVFGAMDLFLFYVFWEIQLIPMYFLIGIWGGARRIYAAIKFFLYTFAGLGADAGRHAGYRVVVQQEQRHHDLRHPDPAERRFPLERPVMGLPCVLRGLRHQGAHVPGAHLAPRCPRGSAHGRFGHPGRRPSEDGCLRDDPLLHRLLP